MRHLSIVFAVAAGLLSGCAPSGPVVFTAMGCGPYGPQDEAALAHYMSLESQAPRSDFIVHLGDIAAGVSSNYDESYYQRVALILSTGHEVPTFVVPGDNEWNDQPDPDTAWIYWTRNFLRFDERFDFGPNVARAPGREENFAFVLRGVLFVGINQVGGRVHDEAEWASRLDDNGQWVSQHLEQQHDIHAAVVFAQAAAGGFDGRFLKSFRAAAKRFGKPILYLHADGHRWFVHEGDWEPNVVHVQVDRVNPQFPPVRITVTADEEQPFLFDRRRSQAVAPPKADDSDRP